MSPSRTRRSRHRRLSSNFIPLSTQSKRQIHLADPKTVGLFAFSVVGLGFLFLAAFECVSTASSASVFHPTLLLRLRFLASLILSSLSILSSFISSFLSSTTGADSLGAALPFSSVGSGTPFLLYSIASLLLSLPSSNTPFAPFPPSLLDLLLLFSFGQEFLFFYIRRKDPDGVENRYFDLLLVPILFFVFLSMPFCVP